MNNPTIAGLLHCGHQILKWSCPENDTDYILECRMILEHLLEIDTVSFFINMREPVKEDTVISYCNLIKRRIEGEPVAYIIGKKEFMSIMFDVSPACLIPRSETELLAETVINHIRSQKIKNAEILEIGTGSGCISVSIAKNISDSRIIACDISQDALNIAIKNAEKNRVGENIKFLKSNFYSNIPQVSFDIIVSNPPYIAHSDEMDEQVRKFEPKEALWSDENGLFATRMILENSGNFLKKGGLLAVEINSYKATETIELFRANGFCDIMCLQDLSSKDRIVFGIKT